MQSSANCQPREVWDAGISRPGRQCPCTEGVRTAIQVEEQSLTDQAQRSSLHVRSCGKHFVRASSHLGQTASVVGDRSREGGSVLTEGGLFLSPVEH